VLGIERAHGHVLTGGLSVLHSFTSRLTLGAEIYGAFAESASLGKHQLQALIRGPYAVRKGLTLTLGALGGKYEAGPRIGFQAGFAVDFPDVGALTRRVHRDCLV
jgi:hypothetical protein